MMSVGTNALIKLQQGIKRTTSHYNPDNHNIHIASKYGGFDEDRGGGSGKNKKVHILSHVTVPLKFDEFCQIISFNYYFQ